MVIKLNLKNEFFSIFVLTTVATVFIDQVLKYLMVSSKPNLNFGILSFNFATNTGAGFGILQGRTVLLSIISLLVAVGIILSYKKIPLERNIQMLFALFLGGVLGNLIDRLFRGHVIDFISFSFWPSFNIADAAISFAAIGLIIYVWGK